MNTPKPIQQPILVSGAHRTGTTWVGRMLAAGGQMAYISEPLNVWHRPGVFRASVSHWYTYICDENQADFLQPLRETLAFRYHLFREVLRIKSFKDLARMGRDWSNFQRARWVKKLPLIKDPFAIFSLAWFIQRMNCQVVITVRHPAAFASSLVRLGWRFDFNNLTQQPLLMRDKLKPYRQSMERAIQHPDDITQQASLLWCVIYQSVFADQARFPQITIVKHEDLSYQPLDGFQRLYANLGLIFNSRAKNAIDTYSASTNPQELKHKHVHSIKLDSRSSLQNWRRRLTPNDIQRIRSFTQDIAKNFYDDDDWE